MWGVIGAIICGGVGWMGGMCGRGYHITVDLFLFNLCSVCSPGRDMCGDTLYQFLCIKI